MPVCDYAGFAAFGFGYRHCPGEQLTIDAFSAFLRKVWRDKLAGQAGGTSWRDKIVFRSLNLAYSARVPVGPSMVIADDVGFTWSM